MKRFAEEHNTAINAGITHVHTRVHSRVYEKINDGIEMSFAFIKSMKHLCSFHQSIELLYQSSWVRQRSAMTIKKNSYEVFHIPYHRIG